MLEYQKYFIIKILVSNQFINFLLFIIELAMYLENSNLYFFNLTEEFIEKLIIFIYFNLENSNHYPMIIQMFFILLV